MPLRWASGGVFPVVTYKGEEWTLFFFRDIKPYGWNIPLGASENTDNLNKPWSFLWREFLEEFLLLCKKPENEKDKVGKTSLVEYRQPHFTKISKLEKPTKKAEEFFQNHIKLRGECDQLFLVKSEEKVEFNIPCGNTTLLIRSEADKPSVCNNILIAINPLELGIEVVSVVEFALNDNNYVLDGEIREPQGGTKELVRMPVALILHRYLKRTFGSGELNYEGDIPPSVKGGPIAKDEIILFDWDMQRRRAIIEDPKLGKGTEYERYDKSAKNEIFGEFFQNTNIETNIPTLFTPTSAKIAGYYFAQQEKIPVDGVKL